MRLWSLRLIVAAAGLAVLVALDRMPRLMLSAPAQCSAPADRLAVEVCAEIGQQR